MERAAIQSLNDQLNASAVDRPDALKSVKGLSDQRQQAETVATQFESLFMGMMMKSMRKTVPESGLLGKGLGRTQYQEMLDQQWAQLGGMPRDPRFHEALVRQIMQEPEGTARAVGRMNEAAAPMPLETAGGIAVGGMETESKFQK
jgi:flagellar protein FlgJ